MVLDPKGQANRLEAEVDSTGLTDVLSKLADVCYEKAEHVRTAWQDEKLSKAWGRAATLVELLANRDEIRKLS